MKKIFTLICALVGFAASVSAATVDDLLVCKHSMVINFSEVTNGGQAKPGKGNLCASGFVLDVTGGSVATNKGASNPSTYVSADGSIDFTTKYAEYGEIKNTFRLKNAQDVIAMKVTAGSKLHFLGQVHSSRYPKVSLKADMSNAFTLAVNTTATDGYSQWVADDDYTIYIGSEAGDWYLGYIIVEANEAPGTPSVTLSKQYYNAEEGMWCFDVTCKANDAEGQKTIVTYTTDGTAPTAASPVYTEPVRVYQNCMVTFQAFLDMEDGVAYEEVMLADAQNAVPVEFAFNAPTITAEGANVTLTAAAEGATNYYKIGDGEWTEGDAFTLTESATITAKSEYENPDIAKFESKTAISDVLVLTKISEPVKISVSGNGVVNEEATAADPNHNTQYMIENGAITADKAYFFVKNLEYAAVMDPNYQINGQEAYIKMNATNITFDLAVPAAVKVVCSKNSCKTINAENDESVTTDRKCYVTVGGSNFGHDDVTAKVDVYNEAGDQVIGQYDGNVIIFDLAEGVQTFKKYSGTGNIMLASIEIVPGKTAAELIANEIAGIDGISNIVASPVAKTVKAIANGRLVIKTAKATYNVAGALVK